jgi:PII-like signaling protein
MGAKISGATVWTGVDGFGKRKRSTIHLEGITINMPMIISNRGQIKTRTTASADKKNGWR